MGIVGEQLLATTGILAALEPGPLKVTKAQLVAASKWPARAKERLGEAIASDKPKASGALQPFDYEHLLEILPPPVTETRLRENVAGWPDQVLADEYAGALGRAWGYLQGLFPMRTRGHLSGSENVRPADVEVVRFRRMLEVVEDPMTIVDRVHQGELLADEVVALKTAYPALAQILRTFADDEIIEETARRRVKDPDWHLPRRKDLMLRRLLERPQGGPEGRSQSHVQKLYQERREQGEQEAPRPPPGGRGKLDDTDAELTRQQKIDAK